MESLQSVKESLLRMRWQRGHSSVASSSSIVNAASSTVRPLPTLGRQQEFVGSSSSSRNVILVADELIRYVLDDEGLATPSPAVDCKTTGSHEDALMSSDPRDVARALQHQQLRAEVSDNISQRHIFLFYYGDASLDLIE